tara:strand:+ start:248 stop:595 length:348 start_codon:yes stop_codon:yes gene_type:complete
MLRQLGLAKSVTTQVQLAALMVVVVEGQETPMGILLVPVVMVVIVDLAEVEVVMDQVLIMVATELLELQVLVYFPQLLLMPVCLEDQVVVEGEELGQDTVQTDRVLLVKQDFQYL